LHWKRQGLQYGIPVRRNHQMPKLRHPDHAGLHLRVVLETGVALGPGRAELLEHIRDLGSIAAASRAMGMSYRRAWMLVDATSREFGAPVVDAAPGGARGGNATLTELGATILKLYRSIEAKAAQAASPELAALHTLASGKKAGALPLDPAKDKSLEPVT
jgi:molybdate transport system regulatory protein